MSKRARLIILLLAGLVVTLQGCAGVVIAGGATAGAMANDRRSSGAFVDDETIEWKIIDVLYEDEEINEQTHLNATSYNGIVLLTGEIPNEEMRVKIQQKIRGVQGVRQLHDETSIAAPSSMMSRSGDTWITTKVKTALLTDDAGTGARTKVVTDKGVVYLMGIVSQQEADKLTDIARRVGGVQKVVKVFEYQT
ncbi:MAG: BON domain-containing protein [Gammaproteobacteria bacterium]|nr:MAG: BON domain-containing protein [Gammaproteobacteria bacterium]